MHIITFKILFKRLLFFRQFAVWIILLNFNVYEVFSQQNYSSKLSGRDSGDSKIYALIDSAMSVYNTDKTQSFSYLEFALDLSIKQKNIQGESKCYMVLGDINKELQQYDLAIDYYNKALNTNLSKHDNSQLQLFVKLAEAYKQLKKYELSNEQYFEALELAEDLKNIDEIIFIKYGIAQNYTELGENRKALNQYKEIVELEERRDNTSGLVVANNSIGEFMLKENNVESAEVYYKRSIEQAQKSKDKKLESTSLRNLSKVYRNTNDYEQELTTRKQSLALNQEENSPEEVFEDNLSIGEIYIQQKKAEEAVSYIQKSIELSDQTGNIKQKGRAYKRLSEAYKEKKEYDKALIAYTNYSQIVDSIHSKRQRELEEDLKLVASIGKNIQRIEMLEKDYMLNKKTVELLKKEQNIQGKELQVQKRINIMLLIVLVVIMLSGFFAFRSLIQKRKANMLLALKSLRSQMNPHFIFNSLNSVNNFISQNNERLANKYLSDFSLLMRNVLENSKHDFVSLESEIEILKLYLKLEHQRFKEKFDYEFDLDVNIEIGSYKIPPMLIQPYIENAVWHGLRYLEEKGNLSVKIAQTNKHIQVLITDNGIGRKKSMELKTKHQLLGVSTGLKNTRGRLNILNSIYHTNFSVTIEDLNKEQETGTVVEILIPKSVSGNIDKKYEKSA